MNKRPKIKQILQIYKRDKIGQIPTLEVKNVKLTATNKGLSNLKIKQEEKDLTRPIVTTSKKP